MRKLAMNNETIHQKQEAAVIQDYDQPISKKVYFDQNKRLAKQGNMLAQFKLAHQYATGYADIPIEIDKAIFWYNQAAKQGFVRAYLRLAELYMSQLKPDEIDSPYARQAADCLLQLHSFQSPLAVTAVDHLKRILSHLDGEFIQAHPLLAQINDELMTTLQEKANVKNDANAQLELGFIYLLGKRAIKKDVDLGFAYIKRAAEQGSSKAQTAVAFIYSIGGGEAVPRDYLKASEWIEKALTSAHTELEIQAMKEIQAAIIDFALKDIQRMVKNLDIFKK